ncbi:MAG TPA: hypothetical protein VGJ22_02325 [Anaerolineales bacterium]|jgi:hypothetical protein
MELLTILAADYANIAEGGKLNVMGVFRNIYAARFPATHPSMALIVKLGAELGEYGDERNLTIRLLNADGGELLRFENPIKIPDGVGGLVPEVNAILAINGIVFPTPGRYEFVVQVDRDHKGSLSIDVSQLEPPGQAAPAQE